MPKQLVKIIIVGFSSVAVLAGALAFVSFDISRRVGEVKELQEKLSVHSQTNEILADIRSDLNRFQPYLPALENALASKNQLINLPRELNSMAIQNSVNVSARFVDEGSDSSTGLSWLGLSMAGEGKFDNLIEFLQTLENSRYFVKLSKLDFNRDKDGFKTTFSGQAFYYEK